MPINLGLSVGQLFFLERTTSAPVESEGADKAESDECCEREKFHAVRISECDLRVDQQDRQCRAEREDTYDKESQRNGRGQSCFFQPYGLCRSVHGA